MTYQGQLINGKEPVAPAAINATTALSPGQYGGATSYTPPPPPPTYNQPTATPTTISALSTPAQIKAFQTAQGLTPDGILGPQTMAAYVKQSPGYSATPSGSAFGASSGVGMGSTTSGALHGAASSLTALYDTKTGFLTAAGVANGSPAVTPGDPNAPKTKSTIPTVDASGNVTLPNGQVINSQGQTITPATQPTTAPSPTIVSSTVDPITGNTVNTLSDGQTNITPPSPVIAGLYGQAKTATDQETNSYNDQLDEANQQYQQERQTLQEQQQNATTAAEANYDTNNPEGAGSDKSEYASSVDKPFIEAIANLDANHQLTLNQLNDAHTANLQNIQTELQSGIQTNAANTYSEATSTLDDVKKGATTLTDTDTSQLVNDLMASGMPYQSAKLEVQSAIQLGNIANDKTNSALDKTQMSEANTIVTDTLKNNPTQDWDKYDPTALASLEGNVIQAGYASDPASALSWLKASNENVVKNQQAQEKINFQNASLNERYTALAQNKSLNDGAKAISLFNSVDTTTLPLADQAALAQYMSTALGLDPQTAEDAVKSGTLKTAPTTTETSGGVKVLGIPITPTVKTTTKGNTSSSSDSTSSTTPAGYYQASDGLYYPNPAK